MGETLYALTDDDRRLIREAMAVISRLRGSVVRPEDPPPPQKAPDVYVAYPQEASGIPARSGTTPGVAWCDLYALRDDGTLQRIGDSFTQPVYNLSTEAVDQDYLLVQRTKHGKWVVTPTATLGSGLVECCLLEDHPGKGVVFDVRVGEWDSTADGWTYSGTAVDKAIDHRYMTEYPEAGSRGTFFPKESTNYGTIYVAVDMDCPGGSSGTGDC